MNLRSWLSAKRVTHHRVRYLNSLESIIKFSRGKLQEERTITSDIIMPVRKIASESLVQIFEIPAIFVTIGPANFFTLMAFISTSVIRRMRQTL